jgi:phosphatidylglycerol---prolipoprotein diacylglyceryl transferase
MTFPVEFHIGPARISAHLLLETLAFFIAFRYFLFLRKRRGDRIEEPNRIWIIIGATAGALFGSRLLGAMESPSALMKTEHLLLYIYSSKTIVGGLLGGLLGVELVKAAIGEKTSSGDLFVYPLLLGMIIGRIGCFLNGTAESVVGLPTRSVFGMNLGDGVLRHPVALYEIVFLVLLWILISIFSKQASWQLGLLFKIFMISYLGFRFGLEFLKPREPIALSLSAIQWACVAGWFYYSGTIWYLLTNRQKLMMNGSAA